MEIKIFENSMTIELPEKISSENADFFKEELLKIDIPQGIKEIIFNGINLKYISSMGFRCLLSFAKEHPDVLIIVDELLPEVYDIFSITGLTEIFNVKKRLSYIDLTNYECLGEGMYGAVYRINSEQILKVFFGDNSREHLEENQRNVRTAFLKGIPTTMPFSVVKTDKGYGQVFELLNTDTIARAIHLNKDKRDYYSREIAELSLLLANTHFGEGQLKNRNDMLRKELLDSDDFLEKADIDYLLECIAAVPDRDTAVHGDFHAKNIMLLEDKPILIDMDDFSEGHPLWDVACIYRIYQYLVHLDLNTAKELFGLPDEVAYSDFYKKIIQLDFEESEALWDQFLKIYFADYTETEVEQFMELTEFYSDFMVIRFLLDQCRLVAAEPEKLAVKQKLIGDILMRMRKHDIKELCDIIECWR